MEKEHITRMQVFRRYRAMNQPICKLKGERACVWVCAWVGAYVCVGVCVGVRGGGAIILNVSIIFNTGTWVEHFFNPLMNF